MNDLLGKFNESVTWICVSFHNSVYCYQWWLFICFSYVYCLLLFWQGPLESVSNLRFVYEASCDSISIAWEAPFSLNLTNAEPDVLYYVDVYNITEGGEVMVESVNITEEYYTFSHANLSLRQEFNFTVTPVSNVLGAVNGTNSEHLKHRLGGN